MGAVWGLLEARLAPAAWTGQWGPAGGFPSPEWLQVSEGMVTGVVPGAWGLEERSEGGRGRAGLRRTGCHGPAQAAPALWRPRDTLQVEAVRFGGPCLCEEAQ